MDPRKNFLCPNGKHVLNDLQRPWGRNSKCPFCEEEEWVKKMEQKVKASKEVIK